MMIKTFLVLIWLGILPAIIGTLFTRESEADGGNLVAAYLRGVLTMLTVFEILALPMSLAKTSLSLLCWCWAGVMFVLTAAALLRLRKRSGIYKTWICRAVKGMTPALILALLLSLGQMGYVTLMQHIDEDDAYYVAVANTAYETDTLYRYNPYTGQAYKNPDRRYILAAWPMFTAMMGRFCFMYPTVMAHMIFPALMMGWVFLLLALYACKLHPGDRGRQGVFLLLSLLILSYMGYSRSQAGTMIAIRSWQGKAVLAGFGLPVLLYTLIKLRDWRWDKENAESWLLTTFALTNCCTFTSMGSVFAGITVGTYLLCRSIRTKQWRYLRSGLLASLPALVIGILYVTVA